MSNHDSGRGSSIHAVRTEEAACSIDHYAIRRALASEAIEDCVLDRVSLAARPFIAKIAGADEDAKGLLLDLFCDICEDPEGTRRAIEAVDPLAEPPPEPPPELPEVDWAPLRLYDLPEALPFPIEAFPKNLAEYAKSVAAAMRSPVDFVGGAMLANAGATAGLSRAISPKAGYKERPLQYQVIVAPPGRGKTPVIIEVSSPINRIDARMRAKSQEARLRWQESLKAHKKDPDNVPPPGPEPLPQCCVVEDITRESLVATHAANPRGMFSIRDEARAWVNAFNEYRGSGSDKQFWLSNYSGAPVRVNRKHDPNPLHLTTTCVSFLGGIQPDFLSSFRENGGGDDGFLDRILFVYPPACAYPPRTSIGAEICPFAQAGWGNAIERIAGLLPDYDEETKTIQPRVVPFSSDGLAAYHSFVMDLAREMDSPDFPERFSGAWSKLEAQVLRMALIMCLLRWATNPLSGAGPEFVEIEDVEAARKLGDYYKAMHRRVVGEINRGFDNPDARPIVRWLIAGQMSEFTERQAYQEIGRFRNDREALASALRFLVSRGAIRLKPAEKGKRGRPGSSAYLVHPELSALHTMNEMHKRPICVHSGHSVHALEGRESA